MYVGTTARGGAPESADHLEERSTRMIFDWPGSQRLEPRHEHRLADMAATTSRGRCYWASKSVRS